MTEQELLNLKQEIEEAKTKVAELQGSKKHLMKELENDWKCTTVKQAEKKLETMKAELEKLKQKIQESTEELMEKYDLEEV